MAKGGGKKAKVRAHFTGEPTHSQTIQALDELPGFWTFFHIRHPDVAIGAPSGPPIGFIPASVIDAKVADTIRAYVSIYRTPSPEQLSDVPPGAQS